MASPAMSEPARPPPGGTDPRENFIPRLAWPVWTGMDHRGRQTRLWPGVTGWATPDLGADPRTAFVPFCWSRCAPSTGNGDIEGWNMAIRIRAAGSMPAWLHVAVVGGL